VGFFQVKIQKTTRWEYGVTFSALKYVTLFVVGIAIPKRIKGEWTSNDATLVLRQPASLVFLLLEFSNVGGIGTSTIHREEFFVLQ
jgi:hypothetical protein